MRSAPLRVLILLTVWFIQKFLAVGSMAVFAIYLRQRGSPESKPVGCPHHTTSAEG